VPNPQRLCADAGVVHGEKSPLFNGLGSAAQATVLIHETFHLGSYHFTDAGLAKTIGWQKPSWMTDPKQIRASASAAFTEELRKHCGW
jgi:hypothetical protein